MRKLTRKFYEEAAKSHRALWRWVGDNPEKSKAEHPNTNVYNLPFQCYACEIKNRQSGHNIHSVKMCKTFCPIINFRCGRNNCAEYPRVSSNYFDMYDKSREKYHITLLIDGKDSPYLRKKVVEYAMAIAELPWFDYDYYVLTQNCLLYESDIEMAKQHRTVEFIY